MIEEIQTLRTPEQMKEELHKLYVKEHEACQEEVNSSYKLLGQFTYEWLNGEKTKEEWETMIVGLALVTGLKDRLEKLKESELNFLKLV